MQTRIVDGRSYGRIGERGIIAVTGSSNPSADEKIECVETVIKLGDDGWAIAADLTTPIGNLTRRAADAHQRTIHRPAQRAHTCKSPVKE